MLSRLWYARWKKVAWLRMLVSGMTLEPSTVDPLLEPWIASWRRIPVSPSPAQESGKAKRTRATSGPISPASSESAALPWCLSKMYAAICASDSSASAEIFKRWAMRLGQDYLALKRWARHTAAFDCSPWPSPKIIAGGPETAERKQELGRLESGGGCLQAATEQWQTPGTDSFRSRGGDRVNEMGLDQEARNWQSPQGRDFRSGEITQESAAKHAGSRPLNEEVLNWPTSRAEDGESCGNHPGAVDSLRGAVENWGTPKIGTNTGHGQADPKRGSRVEDQAQNWKTPHGLCGLDASGKEAGPGGEHAKEANRWNVPTISPLTEPETSTDGLTLWKRHFGCALRWADSTCSIILFDSLVYATWAARPIPALRRQKGKRILQNRPVAPYVRPAFRRKLNVLFDEWLQGWEIGFSSAQSELTVYAQSGKGLHRLQSHSLLCALLKRWKLPSGTEMSLFSSLD